MKKIVLDKELVAEVSALIESTKCIVAKQVNSQLVLLYWKMGRRINIEILGDDRAEYGRKVVQALSKTLQQRYGRGFDTRLLFRMVRFAKQFPDQAHVTELSSQLSWSHFIELISFNDPLKCQFYTEMCRHEHWSVRELRKKVDGMLYERTAISKQPEEAVQEALVEFKEQDKVSESLVFKDPYVLDFLDLPAQYSESSLESAILDELCQFLQELGSDFCFVARQKRLSIDNEDYYVDLLTYHRGLQRLVVIELKLGRFSAAHKGQMELYLNWLDKHERRPDENKPLGLILCADKNEEHVELLEMDKNGIHVAQYLTELPEREVLESRLRKAVVIAQEKQLLAKPLAIEDKVVEI